MHLLKSTGRTVVAAALLLWTSIAGSVAAQDDNAGPAEVESVLAGQLSSSGIPGGAYVIVGGDGTTAGGAGTTADGRKVSASTPFVIGSTTKSFTALAVLQLVDSGDVDLDAAVGDYVPELRLADGEPVDRITVRHVLQQTSGLADVGGGPLLGSAGDGTALHAIAELRDARLVSEPATSGSTRTRTTCWPGSSSNGLRGSATPTTSAAASSNPWE